MGTDNFFHKRRPKAVSELNRKKSKREAYEKVLIVCEGETERLYFKDAIDHYKINSANVVISNDGGSDPVGIVNYATKLYQKEKQEDSGAFDKVYCVFDEDGRKNYQLALDKLQGLKPKNIFYAITSVPCFEYWLLLHHHDTTRPLTRNGAEKELRKHRKHYTKTGKSIFLEGLAYLDSTIKNAECSLKHAGVNNPLTQNPSTQVHKLVVYLRDMKI